jgi:hypothetical protein
MTNQNDIRSLVRIAAAQKILYLPQALRQMSRLDRMITASEVRSVVEDGQVIEDYPEDQRGHSCLMLGYGTGNRPIHVVCSPKDGYLAVITAYIPDMRQWEKDFKTRKKP